MTRVRTTGSGLARPSWAIACLLAVAWVVLLPRTVLAQIDYIVLESGSAEVGSTLTFRFWGGGCSSVRINWGDGSREVVPADPNTLNGLTASHIYGEPGNYTIRATDCDNSAETRISIGGGAFGLGGLDASSPVVLAGLLAVLGGTAALALTRMPAPRLSPVRVQGFIPAGDLPEAGPRGYSVDTGKYLGATPDSPPNLVVGGTADALPPISGGTGYSLDTGRNLGATPEAAPIAPGMTGLGSPSPISGGGGQPMTAGGSSVGVPDLGPLGALQAQWGQGAVRLSWAAPQFDAARNALLGYEISAWSYGPGSTVPVSTWVGYLPPTSTTIDLQFVQSWSHSTGGDFVGYRVEPIWSRLGELGSSFRAGGMFVRVGAQLGTLAP